MPEIMKVANARGWAVVEGLRAGSRRQSPDKRLEPSVSLAASPSIPAKTSEHWAMAER